MPTAEDNLSSDSNTDSDSDSSVEDTNLENKLPQEYKELFFGPRTPPCMTSDFDFVGFNVESIVKWNNYEMRKLVVEVFLNQLHTQFNYPKEITFFDYKRNLNMPMRNVGRRRNCSRYSVTTRPWRSFD